MSLELKVSTMRQAEVYINQLHDQLNATKRQLSDIEDASKKFTRKETAARAAELREEMKKIKDKLNDEVAGLEGQLFEIDRQHRQRMDEQSAFFVGELEELKDWTAEHLYVLEQKVDTQFSAVHQKIGEILQQEADREKQAHQLLSDLIKLTELIDARSEHRKFVPGRFEQLHRRLTNIVGAGYPPETLISRATEIMDALWEMEEDVLKAQMKFELARQQVLDEAAQLLHIMHQNREEVYFTDNEGKKRLDEKGQAVKVEVDFWTMGEYAGLDEKAAALQKELMENGISLSTERLTAVREEIQLLDTEQTELVITAVKRGLASQERRNISSNIVKALKQQGFSLKKSADGPAYQYMGSESQPRDFREGVAAILTHGTGMEITIIVHPDEDMTSNQILFQRNDKNNASTDELRKSITGVRRIIAAEGYELGEAAEPTGAGDHFQPELGDIGMLQTKGLSRQKKQELELITTPRKK